MKRTLIPLLLALGMPLGAANSAPQCKPVPAAVYDVPVVLLVDLSAGQTLYAHEAERRLLPASISKAMSALVAFDLIAAGKLSEDGHHRAPRYRRALVWKGYHAVTAVWRTGESTRSADGADHGFRQRCSGGAGRGRAGIE
ncbi:MAG: hypothetical protein R3E03_08575 [Novosphingobium sp.]